MTYRDAMAALQQKVQALQEELDTLRRDASSDTRAALERAFALEVAVQDAKAAAQIAHLEREREVATARQEADLVKAHAKERIATLERQILAERELSEAKIEALEQRIAQLTQEEE